MNYPEPKYTFVSDKVNAKEWCETLNGCAVYADRYLSNDGKPILLVSYKEYSRLVSLGLIKEHQEDEDGNS